MTESAVTEERLQLAEAFLQEAVYRSREAQARGGSLPGTSVGDGPGNCGLGAQAAVDLDLTDRGAELCGTLWSEGLAPAAAEHIRTVTTEWVQRQDALDRKRNHFMKDFRREHGFDRTRYSAEVTRAWEEGMGAVNAESDAARREVAQVLLARP